jgi:hypothetical protein
VFSPKDNSGVPLPIGSFVPADLVEGLLKRSDDPTNLWTETTFAKEVRELASVCNDIDAKQARQQQLQKVAALTKLPYEGASAAALEIEERRRQAFEAVVKLSETAKGHAEKIDNHIRQEQTYIHLMNMGEGSANEPHAYEDHLSQFGQLIAHAFEEARYSDAKNKHAQVTRATTYLREMRGLYTDTNDLPMFYEGFRIQFRDLPMPEWDDVAGQFAKRSA